MPNTVDPARRLMELMTGYWNTQAVYVAARLGIADRLAGTRSTSAALATELDVDADALGRLLRFLVGAGVLVGDDQQGYALTETGELLRSDADKPLRNVALLYGEEFYRAWGDLHHSVTTGKSAFGHVFGDELFAYLSGNPRTSLSYDRAMVAGTAFFSDVPGAFDFSAARKVVDVAGGHGQLLAEVLRAHPTLRGVLYDAPHVIEEVRRAGGVAADERVELVAGDFFDSVPRGGDVYLLSRILHGFDDEACVRILASCREAMGEDATLLIVERVLPEGTEPSLALGYNLHMLAVMGNGRERGEQEYRVLLEKAGFELGPVRPLPLDAALVTAKPRKP
ncbi:methyltransferase family protein [Saccharopolyspora erythraea NRRL 2338]|uniref:Methyltransferase n=2 Tax=Saccharopolyspora erythraea TaxID=1836 RepID=A0ABN1DGZ8_SACER|nr:methyltransferase [Saccharopolyspora erythraea]EQD81532.1 methyltransferase [Saccharopolyspora erythraea D]PFG97006.1 methyltransferase family protein [Saccharopolyspora erythraea NRRL 2338]QRK87218.1 methyltransferase [Saccharopolyspora erythraea]CAM03302.1 probable phenazine-specific methyltransferase [Saccharopolyspora erythraea NRRL 2338]